MILYIYQKQIQNFKKLWISVDDASAEEAAIAAEAVVAEAGEKDEDEEEGDGEEGSKVREMPLKDYNLTPHLDVEDKDAKIVNGDALREEYRSLCEK